MGQEDSCADLGTRVVLVRRGEIGVPSSSTYIFPTVLGGQPVLYLPCVCVGSGRAFVTTNAQNGVLGLQPLVLLVAYLSYGAFFRSYLQVGAYIQVTFNVHANLTRGSNDFVSHRNFVACDFQRVIYTCCERRERSWWYCRGLSLQSNIHNVVVRFDVETFR